MGNSVILESGILLSRVFVGLTLFAAGLLKIRAGSNWFLQRLLTYDLIKGSLAVAISKGLPWVEVACGALMIPGLLTPLVTLLSFFLLTVFTMTLIITILRERPADCGCFGRAGKMSRTRWTIVYRNITLMSLLLPIYASMGSNVSVDSVLNIWPGHPNRGAYALTELTTVCIMLLVISVVLQTFIRVRMTKHIK